MGLLDQLFGIQGANPQGWAQQMQAQMTGGPMMGPLTTNGAPSSMLGAKPPQAGERKMFPAPDAPKVEAPTMSLGGSAPVEAPGAGTYLKGALRGFGGEDGGFGILGAIGGAMNAGDEVTKQNALYRTLVEGGIDPRTAQLAIKQPEALRVIQANQEKKKAEQQSTELITQRMRALMQVPNMTQERAFALARDEAGFRDAMKSTGHGAQDQTPEGRAQLARSLGIKEGTDAFNSYVMTGKLPREDQQRLTVTDKKAILEADEAVNAAEGAVASLMRAKELSKTAYDGATANERAWITSQFGSQAGEDTRELKQTVTEGALQQLKAIFGGMPTEGERKVLLEVQGSAELPQAVREKIYDRAIALAQKRIQFNKDRARELRSGTFYQQDEPVSAPLDGTALQGRGSQPLLGAGASGKSRIIGVE